MTEIIKPEKAEIARTSDPAEVLRMLMSAVESKADVEALKELVALRNQEADRLAREELNGALRAFQRDCPKIEKVTTAHIRSQKGSASSYSYRYAPLEHIAEQIAPVLDRHGLSYAWDSKLDGSTLTCTFVVTHVAGASKTATFTCPTDSSAPGISPQQKVAAALSFAKRQSMCSGLGITTADPDNDAGMDTITDSQAADLRAMIEEVGANERRFLKVYGVERVEDLKAHNYSAAIALLQEKRRSS